ncbi:hypothetical protein CMO88_00895 [Candidatus Woesearchaeota archaeon]|nr:hypothetical protein [Candidatus Woesearchaeota archaeon]|tara:strand:- start:15064 stop:15921 length:858 start_codon:yes stop_codon:yes gene_type:complete
MKIKLLSIVIPVYNEERSIDETIKQIRKVMASTSVTYEIIAVNDGSEDKSKEILDNVKNINVVHNAYNLGYGASLKRGILASKGDWILITDADGTYPLEDIPKLLSYDNYDMVVGARTGKSVKTPFLRKPAKFIIGTFANLIVGQRIPDVNSGFRVFRKEIAMRFFNLFPQGFSFTITITLACLTNAYLVKYVPINYLSRTGKSSIHPIKDFIGFMILILRMATLFKPVMVFSTISALLFAASVSVFLYSFFVLQRLLDLTVLILFLGSLQIFLYGLLAEVIKNR